MNGIISMPVYGFIYILKTSFCMLNLVHLKMNETIKKKHNKFKLIHNFAYELLWVEIYNIYIEHVVCTNLVRHKKTHDAIANALR